MMCLSKWWWKNGWGGGRSGPSATFLSGLNRMNTSRTYLMRFDVINMMAALKNKLYSV